MPLKLLSLIARMITSSVYDMVDDYTVACKVCPKKRGKSKPILLCHLDGHSVSNKHKWCLEKSLKQHPNRTSAAIRISVPHPNVEDSDCSFQAISIEATTGQTGNDDPLAMLDTDFGALESPLEDLWQGDSTMQMYGCTDYFKELQAKMANGKSLLNCLMHSLDDELGIEIDKGGHEDADGPSFNLEGIHDIVEHSCTNISIPFSSRCHI